MNYNDILEKMLNGELKPYQLDKMFGSKIATEIRRKFIEKKVGIEFKHISNYSIDEEMAMKKNIENMIGAIQSLSALPDL